ncbi:MAG: hypothetical protein AAGU02_03690 [Lawsonibacter sp.]
MSGNLREVNLERGMPRADQAIRQLTFELHRSRSLGFSALKLIHGYGSSGTGGRIRIEARNYLARLQAKGEIAGLIPGEEFSIFNSATLDAFRRCGDLRQDRDLDRHNNGVTFVLL